MLIRSKRQVFGTPPSNPSKRQRGQQVGQGDRSTGRELTARQTSEYARNPTSTWARFVGNGHPAGTAGRSTQSYWVSTVVPTDLDHRAGADNRARPCEYWLPREPGVVRVQAAAEFVKVNEASGSLGG